MGTPSHRSPDRNTRGLQTDSALFRWKLTAGIVSVVLLGGFFITSLQRGPNPVYSIVVAVVTVLVVVAMAWGALRAGRRRRDRR